MERSPAFRRLILAAVVGLCGGLIGSTLLAQDAPAVKDIPLPDLGLYGKVNTGPATLEADATLIVENAARGQIATLAVEVVLPPEYYIYSTNRSFGGATKITVLESAGLEPIDDEFTPDHPPKVEFERLLDQNVEKFFGRVTWARRYQIAADPASQPLSVKVQLEGQYCSTGPNGACIPIRPPRILTAALQTGPVPVPKTSQTPETHPLAMETRPVREVRGEQKPDPVSFKFELAPANAKPGDEVTLTITASIDDEWHTFALTHDPKMAAKPTEIELADVNNLEPISPQFEPDAPPKTERPLDDIVQQVHYGKVSWSRKFKVLPGAAQDGYGVGGTIRYQLCRHGACLPPWSTDFVLGNARSPEAGHAAASALVPPPATEAVGNQTAEVADAMVVSNAHPQRLWTFLLAAIGAGFGALLTPCVFPMVPITVSFFLKQSEKEHHRPIGMAATYCAGIIITFTALGLLMAVLFGATALNQLSNNPWLNLGIAGVLVFFGLNLLGLFEIRLPSGLLTWSSGHEGKGGIAGTLFMALTFTLVSFTCTFSFAGLLLVMAANGEYYWPILGMLAFSAAFSLPFFFLALFPSYLNKLPKSGGWMNAVKVTMGMIELGAAFKFLSVADLAWNPVPLVFDYSLVMAAWMVIAVCTGLYLLGLFRLSHDTTTESISVLRLVAAMLFLGLGGYLAVGVYGAEKPVGKLWEQIAAFAPQRIEGGVDDIGPYLQHDGLKYALDFEQAVAFARSRNQPLFLDFTGVNCVNCRLMESRMAHPSIRSELEKFIRVQLYTDNVPTIADEERVEKLLAKNRDLQENWFGDVTLPAYALVAPDGRTLLAAFKGVERTEGEFAEFLRTGYRLWEEQSSSGRMAQR